MNSHSTAAQTLSPGKWQPGENSECVPLLLASLLVRVRRYGDMPLRFDVDAARMARETWAEFSASAAGPCEWRTLAPAVDEAVEKALPCAPGQTPWRGAASAGSFEAWVRKFQSALRKADSQAAEAAALLVEGWPPREAARRMGLGVRLLARITAAFHSVACEAPD